MRGWRHALWAALSVSLLAAGCGSKPPSAVTSDAGAAGGGNSGGGRGGNGGNAGAGPTDAATDTSDRDVAADMAAGNDARPDLATTGDTADAPRTDGGGDASGGGPYPEAPGLCRAGWCWSNPLLHGNSISSMCGRSLSDVSAVGSGATVLHWDGTRWSDIPTGLVVGTSPGLYDVWCSPGESVWAVGEGAVLRLRNGVVTNLTPPGTDIFRFLSVGGTAEDDVWIGASEEIALHATARG